jgi:hypothetical protein
MLLGFRSPARDAASAAGDGTASCELEEVVVVVVVAADRLAV